MTELPNHDRTTPADQINKVATCPRCPFLGTGDEWLTHDCRHERDYATIAALRAELAEAGSENSRWKAQYNDLVGRMPRHMLDSINRGREPHWREFPQHVTEYEAMRADLEQTTDERNALLHARTALRAELARVEREAETATECYTDTSEERDELRAELAQVKHQRDVLAREMPSIERAVDVEMVRADNAEAELERVTTERDALAKRLRECREEYLRHRAEVELTRPVVEAAEHAEDVVEWLDDDSARTEEFEEAWQAVKDTVRAYRTTSEQETSE